MQISLRSQLIAGAAAIVGTSAVAIAPIAAPAVQLSTLHAPSVALTAFANPVTTLMGSMSWVANDLFNSTDTYTPFDMFQGMIPEWTYLNNPVQTQMSFNRDAYINDLIQGFVTGDGGDYPVSSFNHLSNMVWGLPSTTITAFQQLLSGDIDAALATINAGIVLPLQEAVGMGFETVAGIVSQIVGNVVNVLGSIPSLVTSFVAATTAIGETLAGTAVASVTQFIDAITSGDFEGAWNAAVVGALGQDGYAGALETLTIGPGFGTWGEEGYVPSFRVWGEGAILTLANDLGANWNVTPPVVEAEPAAAAASVAPASVVVAEEAPAADKGIEAPAADSAATTVADNAADSAPSAGSSKAGDNDAKAGSDAKSGTDAKASGGKGHARSHGSVRAKADNAA